MRITADTIELDGSIRANGGTGGGGGSGGGIRMDVGVLSGIGTMSADAENEDQTARGGGGRIAIYYDDILAFNIARISARGGGGSILSNRNAGAGTIYFQGHLQNNGDLTIANGGSESNGFSTPLRAVSPGTSSGLDADRLIDDAGNFPLPNPLTGRLGLIGLELNPNTAQNKTFTIIDNTATQIFTDPADGNMTLVANVGNPYIGQYFWDNAEIRGRAKVQTADDCLITGSLTVIEQSRIECHNQSVESEEPPVITSAPETAATNAAAYRYDVEATDPNLGDVLTFSLTVAPVGMGIDPATGLISWTPTIAQLGEHPVTVRVQDAGGLFSSQSFTISVNNPPVISSTPNITATEAQTYNYDVEATDPDAGQVLAFSLDVAPTGMSIDSTTGLIAWTPTTSQAGDNAVTVRVQDSGGLIATQRFTITVNGFPHITSSAKTEALAKVPYSNDVNATDPNAGDTLTFSLGAFPTGMTINSATGLIQWTPTVLQVAAIP